MATSCLCQAKAQHVALALRPSGATVHRVTLALRPPGAGKKHVPLALCHPGGGVQHGVTPACRWRSLGVQHTDHNMKDVSVTVSTSNEEKNVFKKFDISSFT